MDCLVANMRFIVTHIAIHWLYCTDTANDHATVVICSVPSERMTTFVDKIKRVKYPIRYPCHALKGISILNRPQGAVATYKPRS
jgi:glycerol-3-phosphate dehydrogenase